MKTDNRGFTVVELIIVFLVIGIIAVISAAQLPDMEEMRISKAAQKIQSDIRFAQRLAMQLQRRTAVLFSAADDNYSIYIENTYQADDWNADVKAKNPLTQEDFDVQLNSEEFSGVDITYVLFNSVDYALVFDRNGDPYAMDFINPATISVLSGVGRIVLNTNRKYILMQPVTGRVNVQDAYP